MCSYPIPSVEIENINPDLEESNDVPANRYKYFDEKKQHLHTLDGKPLIGTSTVTKIIAKTLTWWASGMALTQLGWTNPKLVKKEDGIEIAAKARKNFFINNEEYYDWLQECYRAHDMRKKDAGKTGVDMHEMLEIYVRSCIDTNKGIPLAHNVDESKAVSSFTEWSMANVDTFLFAEGHCYSERLWVGGIADAGAKMKDGNIAIFDFKSAKAAYYDHFIQAAGYALQIAENGVFDKDGNQILGKMEAQTLYIVPFGSEDTTPRPHFDVQGRMQDFEAAVRLYKGSQIFEK